MTTDIDIEAMLVRLIETHPCPTAEDAEWYRRVMEARDREQEEFLAAQALYQQAEQTELDLGIHRSQLGAHREARG